MHNWWYAVLAPIFAAMARRRLCWQTCWIIAGNIRKEGGGLKFGYRAEWLNICGWASVPRWWNRWNWTRTDWAWITNRIGCSDGRQRLFSTIVISVDLSKPILKILIVIKCNTPNILRLFPSQNRVVSSKTESDFLIWFTFETMPWICDIHLHRNHCIPFRNGAILHT